ncbi:MAG: hypothetical protein IKK29_05735 [Christensenellaceae bacterium]|nr:hypothetical protein [Christensenellaceae bacterium]
MASMPPKECKRLLQSIALPLFCIGSACAAYEKYASAPRSQNNEKSTLFNSLGKNGAAKHRPSALLHRLGLCGVGERSLKKELFGLFIIKGSKNHA